MKVVHSCFWLSCLQIDIFLEQCSWNVTETAAGRCNKTEAEEAVQFKQPQQSVSDLSITPGGTCLKLSWVYIIDIVTDQGFLITVTAFVFVDTVGV